MAIFLRLTGIAENAEITKECIGHLQGLADIMKVRNPGVLTYLFHAVSLILQFFHNSIVIYR